MKKLKVIVKSEDVGIFLTNGREERDRFSTIVMRNKNSQNFRRWFGLEI